MGRISFLRLAGLACGAALSLSAAERFVWTNSPAPDGQYLTWATAARDIQAAINAAATGDVITVTNGVYDRGGVAGYPAGATRTNRVAIYKAVTVWSVNGPDVTAIKGAWDPVSTNGPASVRCVYMTNGAVLIGFTLTNGTTDASGGGIWSESTNAVVSNCVIVANRSVGGSGGAYRCTLRNCLIADNRAIGSWPSGGGIAFCTVYNSTIRGNSGSADGGGIYRCTLYNCLVEKNWSGVYGGGMAQSVAYNCTIRGNTGNAGGGAFNGWGVGDQYNCVIVSNSASTGGGICMWCDWGYLGGAYNCLIAGNYASSHGGGVDGYGVLYNCTIINNSVAGSSSAGGAGICSTNFSASATRTNYIAYSCIVYSNLHPHATTPIHNYTPSTEFRHSCSTPLPPGAGNIADAPRFLDPGSGYGLNHMLGDYRPAVGSLCINAGTNFAWMTNTFDVRSKDLNGCPRIWFGTVDMGAYEHFPAGTIFMIKGGR